MNNKFSKISVIIFQLILSFFFLAGLAAQNFSDEVSIAYSIKTETDSLKYKTGEFQKPPLSKDEIKAKIQEIDEERNDYYNDKINSTKRLEKHYRDFINKFPNSQLLPEAYYHLSNICFEVLPLGEHETYNEIINYYKKLLEINPDYKHKDVVYYNLAFSYYQKEKIIIDEKRQRNPELLGELPDSLRLLKHNLEKPIAYYEKIIEGFPNSDFYLETIYRLGDIYFDLSAQTRSHEKRNKYLGIAKNFYESLLSKESDLVENAIYKLGWAYFSINKYSSAIERFIELLNTITLNDSIVKSDTLLVAREKAKKSLERAKIFKEEALQYLSLCFVGYDSTNYTPTPIGTEMFKQVVNEIDSEEYAKIILDSLAGIYVAIDYQGKARATYSTFLDLFPIHEYCPSIANKIVKSYVNNELIKDAEKEKEKIALLFSANSDWYQKNKDNENVMKTELPIIKEAYEYTINKKVKELIANEEKLQYEEAIKFSELYLELFPESEKVKWTEANIAHMYFGLSEIEKDTISYYKAINKLQKLNEKYPDSPDRFNNAYNIIFAYQSILDIIVKEEDEKKELEIDTISIASDTLYQDTLLATSKMNVRKNLLSACDNYRKLLAEKAEVASKEIKSLLNVLKLQGSIYFSDEKNYSTALPIFEEILNLIEEDKKTDYTYNIAICYKELGDNISSEEWFRKAEKLAVRTKNKEIKESAAILALESIQHQAAQLENDEDFIGAAQQLERLAKTDLKADYSFDNMLSAAQKYEKANDLENAIRTYLFIVENYDNLDKDTQIISTYYKVATIVDSLLNDYEREIEIYQKIAERYPNSKDSREAELQIISLYDDENKINEKKTAADKYIEFANKYRDWENSPDMFDNAIYNYNELGDTTKVITLCLEFAELFPYNPTVLDKFQRVLKEYIDMDRWSKAEEIALQIKRKFPEQQNIANGVAKVILDKIEAEVDTLYENNNFSSLPEKMKEYHKKDEYFRGKDINLNLKFVYAKHKFYEGDILFADFIQDSVGTTVYKRKFDSDIKRLFDKRAKLAEIYGSLKDYNIAKWWTGAIHRLGLVDEHLFYELDRAVTIFATVYDEINQEAFLDAMSEMYIYPIYDAMVQYFYANHTLLEEQKIENEWTLASRKKLYELGELERPEENYEYLTIITDSTWNYSNTFQKNFSKIDFVDSLSAFVQPRSIELDSIGIDTLTLETDAQFVWGLPKDSTLYFRKVFELNGIPEIARLTLISSNDTYIFINGRIFREFYTLENEEDWQTGKNTDIADKLNMGKNVIALQTVCDTATIYKGILVNLKISARILVEEEIFVDTTYSSNSDWLVYAEVEEKWYDFNYNDSLWSQASIIQVDSLSSFSEIADSITYVIWDSLASDTVYFRYRFTAPDSVELAELKIAVDTIFSIYVNGEPVAGDSSTIRIADKYQPTIFDVTDFISTGENIVAIKAIANQNSYGMISEIHLQGVIRRFAYLMGNEP